MSPRVRVGLSMALTLLAVEALCRSEALFRRPDTSGVSLYHRKAAWLAASPPVPIYIAGDSTGQQGIDAAVFGAAAGQATRNAAFLSGSPIVARGLLGEHVPARVVFALSALLLSDSWTAEPPEVDAARPFERIALCGVGPGLLDSLWATYLRRRSLAAAVKGAVGLGRGGGDPAVRDFGSLRGAPMIEDDTGSLAITAAPDLGGRKAQELLDQWLGLGPGLGPRSGQAGRPRAGVRLAAMEELAERWQRQGTEAVYVLMPLHSTLREALSLRPEARDFQSEVLSAIVRRRSGRLLDCRAAVPDAGFHDADHLAAGPLRRAFSERLGAAVASGAAACPGLGP